MNWTRKVERRYEQFGERAFAAMLRLNGARRGLNSPPVTHAAEEIFATVREHGVWVGSAMMLQDAELLPQIDLSDLVCSLNSLQQEGGLLEFKMDDDRIRGLYSKGLISNLYSLIAETYGTDPIYLGAHVKREVNDGFQGHVRQWHKDTEDNFVLKIIIYGTEVNENSGPFQYISLSGTEEINKQVNDAPNFICDEKMMKLVGGRSVCECVGPAGTAIVFDGARLFHRAKPPVLTHRDSVTFSFVSSAPRRVFKFQRPTSKLRKFVREAYPEFQRRIPPSLSSLLVSIFVQRREQDAVSPRSVSPTLT